MKTLRISTKKNNWRKLYDRKDLYTSMVDKFKIKHVITERAGEKYTFPLLGVWDKPEEIEWDTLPEQFVLKSNHAETKQHLINGTR